MKITTQFSVFLPNKPGALARIMDAIAERRISLVALTIVDTQEHGVVRLVAENDQRLGQLLRDLNVAMTDTKVLSVDLSNRAGALAKVVHLLSDNKVNIRYAYVTSGAPGGRATGVLKVDNMAKAMKILEPKKGKKERTAHKTVRRQGKR